MSELDNSHEAAAWWREWRKLDFSWHGLGAKDDWGDGFITSRHRVWGIMIDEAGAPVRDEHGGPRSAAATLQDYWRWKDGRLRTDAEMIASGELVWRDGTEPTDPENTALYHLAHLPLTWEDGAPTPKADRRFDIVGLSELIRAKIQSAFSEDHPWGFARLTGIVLHPSHNVTYLFSTTTTGLLRADLDRAFLGRASFGQTRIKNANFRECLFHGNFRKTRFVGPADFYAATFYGPTTFANSTFQSSVTFSRAKFEGSASFTGATFHGDAAFDGAILGDATFDDTRFQALAEFDGATLGRTTSFDGTVHTGLHRTALVSGLVATGLVAATVTAFFTTDQQNLGVVLTMSAVTFAWTVVGGAITAGTLRILLGQEENMLSAGEDRLRTYEKNFRALKASAGASRNHEVEALATALELKASRLRIGNRPPWGVISKSMERLFSLAYELTSDYGRSIWRPLLALALSTVFFATLYQAHESGVWSRPSFAGEDSIDALTFSSSRSLPIGPWGDLVTEDGRCSFRERLFGVGSDRSIDNLERPCRPAALQTTEGMALATHSLASQSAAAAQSVISIVLIFLFGLGIRRRFQIG